VCPSPGYGICVSGDTRCTCAPPPQASCKSHNYWFFFFLVRRLPTAPPPAPCKDCYCRACRRVEQHAVPTGTGRVQIRVVHTLLPREIRRRPSTTGAEVSRHNIYVSVGFGIPQQWKHTLSSIQIHHTYLYYVVFQSRFTTRFCIQNIRLPLRRLNNNIHIITHDKTPSDLLAQYDIINTIFHRDARIIVVVS